MSVARKPPVGVIVGTSPVRLFGLSGEERLARLMRRAGLSDIRRSADGSLGALDNADSVVVARADHVFEEPLLFDLVGAPGVALHAEGVATVAALHVPTASAGIAARALADGGALPEDLASRLRHVEPGELTSSYNNRLRKRAVPYLLEVTRESAPDIEKRMFAGSYKGVTDLVTKYIFPWPSRHVTAWAAAAGLKPNHVTTAGLFLAIAAFWLFYVGELGFGLAAGWMLCLLDTVDGKLARVTLTSSKFGDLFDHLIDLIHPPFWWWAWLHGLGPEFGARPEADVLLAVLVVGYVAQRLEEGVFIKAFGIEMHIWRPFDSWFRLITARRDPNMLLLMVAFLVGEPVWGIRILAVWTALCFFVHLVQIVQATFQKMGGRPIRSWLVAEPEAAHQSA